MAETTKSAPAAEAKKYPVDGGRPTMDFNINFSVLVKLNEAGIAELKRQHEELRKRAPSLREWQPPSTDENGFAKFQLWDLMQRLGPLCQMGWELPFDTTIKIILDQK